MADPRITEVDMLFMGPKLIDMITALPLEFHKKYAKELLFIPRLIPEIQRLRAKALSIPGLVPTRMITMEQAKREYLFPKERPDGPTV